MSTTALQEQVRATCARDARLGTGAAARAAAIRIVAGGTWLDAGRPVRDAAPFSLAGDDAIVEYVAGDLTLTARAGAPLAEIARVTAAEGQWLALDPFGAATGTLGATIATGSAGPLAHAFGTPRDNVLGVEAVTGTGDIVRAGGRVVKNVAGFDLTRLFTGAWGTLAVITEATVRLRARPERDETIALALPSGDEMEAWLAKLRALPFSALALELLNASLSRALGLGDRALLLARLGGNADSVRAQLQAMRVLGEAIAAPPSTWRALAEIEPAGAAVARISASPSRLHALWARHAHNEESTFAHASVGRGIVRCIHRPTTSAPVAAWLEYIARTEGTHMFERLPASDWEKVPAHVNDPLSRAVRAAFDPRRVLNRGILGDVA
ncbi:MAG: FAD-binding oxidoreductase [Gemmatimonadota bacterium]|nr:FAD-binding oxidoreductase [Gemmatimonadota bacterium]